MKYIFYLVVVIICFSCGPSKEDKTRNGIHLSEVLQPFEPKGLEKNLYAQGSFQSFYSKLQAEIEKVKNTMQNGKAGGYVTNLKFWGGDMILYDSEDAMFFFRVVQQPRTLELNIHNLSSKQDLKNSLRVGLINEAVNMVFFDGSPFTMQKHIEEEMLSDFAMSMCPDSSNNGWFQIVAGRLMPSVELAEFKSLDDMTIVAQMGIEPPGYIKLIRIYASELTNSLGQSAEDLSKVEQSVAFVASINCKDDERCLHESIISFWKSQLTPGKLQKFKMNCQKRYQKELKEYW